MDIVHEEIRNGMKIKIVYDNDCCNSPENWQDDNLFLVGYHDDFFVKGREKIVDKDLLIHYFNDCQYEDESVCHEAKELKKNYWVFPLSAYIHSGVRLYMGSHKVCTWDSCQVGAVLVAKSEWKTSTKAKQVAEGLIKSWNDYLSGNVYGFQIENEVGKEIESCYGFIGDYEEGALDEACSIVDNMTHKGETESNGQLVFKF